MIIQRTGMKRGRAMARTIPMLVGAFLTTAAFGEGGDTISNAVLIDQFPFTDTGDTSDNSSTNTPSCADFASPDVWYQILPTEDIWVEISLCGSAYDTSLYVLNGVLIELDCNNDFCDEQSQLDCMLMEAGLEYYIGVDGAGNGAAGAYEINIVLCEPQLPCTQCAPEAIMEGEPPCGPGYVDTYNGGCNSSPPVFLPISCGDVYCGESGVFENGGFRDTDWYELVLTQTTTVTFEGNAEFPLLLLIYDGNDPCPGSGDPPLINWSTSPTCELTTVVSQNLPPGTYWLWAGPWDFGAYPCGSIYNIEVTCGNTQPCEVECDPGALLEGEPDCFPGYEDNYNGGCNASPPVFQPIDCNTTICGTSGTWEPASRDTDWFRSVSPGDETLTFTATAEFELLLFLVDAGSEDCQDHQILDTAIAAPCEPATIVRNATAGVYWLWVGPATMSGIPCPSTYNASLLSDNCQAEPCREDINGDNVVNVLDLLAVLAAWGGTGGPEDVNGDGVVNVLDLLSVLGAWGPCP